MVEAGLTPCEALVAATTGSARALGMDDRGLVAAGNVGDLVVVDGDPLTDISVLVDPARIALVVQGGRPVAGRSWRPSGPDLRAQSPV